MARTSSLITIELRHLVFYFLDHYLSSNALFFASQLHAHDPSSADTSHLLSLCYFRMNQLSAGAQASEYFARNGRHIGCAYVYAQCCLGLRRFKDGFEALESCRPAWSSADAWEKHSEKHRQTLPDAAAIQCLLGKLYYGNNDIQAAIGAYSAALKLHPFMWDAFAGLCEIGAIIQVPNIFKVSSEKLAIISRPLVTAESEAIVAQDQGAYLPQQNNRPTDNRTKSFPTIDPFGVSTRHNLQSYHREATPPLDKPVHGLLQSVTKRDGTAINPNSPGKADTSHLAGETQVQNVRAENGAKSAYSLFRPPKSLLRWNISSSLELGDEPPHTPPRPTNTSQNDLSADLLCISDNAPQDSGSPIPFVYRKRTASQAASENTTSAGARRSVRLKSQTQSKMSTISSMSQHDDRQIRIPKARNSKRVGTTSSAVSAACGDMENPIAKPDNIETQSGLARLPTKTTMTEADDSSSEIHPRYMALQWLLDLVEQLASGYYLLSCLECEEALRIYKSLPIVRQETSWVLLQMARANFELANYSESAKLFRKVRTIAPLSVEDMDIFSTVLWHLKSDVDLAFLSYELVQLDRLRPQTWCVMGNSFSLQRDHANAIECFKRATQLDPEFAYAFTLEGHEHLQNEEYEKAILAFQKGISAKKRHYNAWYGLGIVFHKLGKYEMAEKHFRIASRVNPRNAVLIGCIGMALEYRKEYHRALEYYNRACNMLPSSVLARARKAEILLKLGDLRNASVELIALKHLAPQMAHVYILLGRMYGMARDKGKAMQNFTIALSLSPHAASSIKADMEALEDNDDVMERYSLSGDA